MKRNMISQDDLEDVKQMSDKLEKAINEIFEDADLDLCMSSLIGTVANEMLSQCDDVERLKFYGDTFVYVLKKGIERMYPEKSDA